MAKKKYRYITISKEERLALEYALGMFPELLNSWELIVKNSLQNLVERSKHQDG